MREVAPATGNAPDGDPCQVRLDPVRDVQVLTPGTPRPARGFRGRRGLLCIISARSGRLR